MLLFTVQKIKSNLYLVTVGILAKQNEKEITAAKTARK